MPTRPYKKKQTQESTSPLKPGPLPITKIQRSFYGASYLLDQIGQLTGVAQDLKSCFPQHYQQILSIAYYLILEGNNPLNRFSHWQRLHLHPYGRDIPSQRSSDLFQSIDEEQRMAFSKSKGNVALKKNTGYLILPPSPVIQKH